MPHYLVGTASDKGRKRPNNEDSFSLPSRGLPEQLMAQRGFLAVVADGVGGQSAGQVASQTAVRRVQEVYYDPGLPFPNARDALRQAVVEANRAVWETAQRQDQMGMASTVVAAVLREGELTVAHAGDSRAYLIGPGGVRRLTVDHTVVNELVASGALTEAEAATHPQRHVISRALGSKEKVDVTINTVPFGPTDALLLCSDGLWNPVPDDRIAEVVRTRPPQPAAGQLVALANAAGGPDNVTAVIVRQSTPGQVANTLFTAREGLMTIFKKQPAIPIVLTLGLVVILSLAIAFAARPGKSAISTSIDRSPATITSTATARAIGEAVTTGRPTATYTPTKSSPSPGGKRRATLQYSAGGYTYLYQDKNILTGHRGDEIQLDGTAEIVVDGKPESGESTGYIRSGGGYSKLWFKATYKGKSGWVVCPLVVFQDEPEGPAECPQ